jgi:hypothetical protein
MPWRLDEPHASGGHARMIALEIIRFQKQENRPPVWSPMRAAWAGVSARAKSRPQPPLGGRTTTQRLPPPSGVSSQS